MVNRKNNIKASMYGRELWSEEFLESLSKKERKKIFEEYRELLLSELLLAAMEQDNISVRKLAKLSGVSPTVVQSMRLIKNFFH